MEEININIKKKEYHNNKINQSHKAIENFNLKIPKGEFCSIVGPSGCGKTTLLNLICGLDKSLEGEINFGKNKNLENINIAYMFQTPRLLPWLSVVQNVEVVLNKNKINSNSEEILSLMGLKKFLDYYPNKLSGGMQRRVALARSFASEPELLIMDEPFTSLDEPVANLLRKMLVEIWTKRPTTIIFVTHDIKEAIFLSDRIVFLSKSPAKVLKDLKINSLRPRNIENKDIDKIKNDILLKNSTILKGEI